MKNIENEVLYTPKLKNKIQQKYPLLFKDWALSKQFPEHKNKGTQACIDLLNSFDDQDISLLEEYYNQKINIQRFHSNQTKIINKNKFNIQEVLNKEVKFCKTFFPYLDGDELLIYIWS